MPALAALARLAQLARLARLALLALLGLGLVACAESGRGLIIEPPQITVTITDDAVVTQDYKAYLYRGGQKLDVTADTHFAMNDDNFGHFSGTTLTITGQGSGPAHVIGRARGVHGDADIIVYVKKTIVDDGAPPDSRALFDAATEDASLAPKIVYPPQDILVPPNLGEFDVHWQSGPTTADLFELIMENKYVDIRLYTRGAIDVPYWTVFPPKAWYPIASSRERLTLRVAGLDTARPMTKGSAAPQHVDVTNESTKGGIYYWTSSNPPGIWRYDVGTPEVPPTPYFAETASPSGCMGCHTLSRDGTKMAITLDGAGGRGSVFSVADRKPMFDFNGPTPLRWDFAAFDSRGTKLLTVENGQIFLRGLDGSMLAGPMPPLNAGQLATQPELSPDDSKLVSVEYASGADWSATGGSLVIRSFNASTNSFGTPTTLVPATGGSAAYYPSFSPDGEWIVFTRTTGYSYNDISAQTWLVKADGSMPPVQLSSANLGENLTNSWARWVPFGQTFGPKNEPLFYLTYSSQRAFGVRIPAGARRPQVWMTPVFPARAERGEDPSGPAFRVPFQGVQTNNHIAQWTESVQ